MPTELVAVVLVTMDEVRDSDAVDAAVEEIMPIELLVVAIKLLVELLVIVLEDWNSDEVVEEVESMELLIVLLLISDELLVAVDETVEDEGQTTESKVAYRVKSRQQHEVAGPTLSAMAWF